MLKIILCKETFTLYFENRQPSFLHTGNIILEFLDLKFQSNHFEFLSRLLTDHLNLDCF